MTQVDRMFVYGTLKRGGYYHHLVEAFVRAATPASVPGVLLDLGDYPGWVKGAGRTRGEVLLLQPIDLALRVTDELEDYRGPGNPANLYDRVLVEATTPEGPVEAWCYQYLGTRKGVAAIPGGDWSEDR